jgi:hypothetical protein
MKCLSRMKGNFHVRFLEESERVIAPSYSARAGNCSSLFGDTGVYTTLYPAQKRKMRLFIIFWFNQSGNA